MGRKMKKSLAIILAITGILLLAVIWRQSLEAERGITLAEMPIFEPGAINSINITKGDRHINLEQRTAGWYLKSSKGLDKVADSGKILRLINALSETKFGELTTDSPARHEVYEISDTQGIAVTLLSGGTEQFKLIFGKRGKDGTVFIRLPGHKEVFRGIKAPLHELALDELSWREKHIFSNNPEEITKVIASFDGSSYTLTRDGSSFNIKAADLDANYRLDKQRAAAFMRSLALLKAADFIDEESASIGEVSASFAISFGQKVKNLFIGTQNDKGQYKALVEGQDDIYLLPQAALEQIKKPLPLLRDLTLFNVDIPSIKRVRFGGEEPAELISDGAGNFTPADGNSDSDFDLKSAQIAVKTLAALRASRYLGPSGTLGISKNSRFMEIEDKNGLHRVTIGDKDDNNLYITVSSDYPGTYGLDAHNLKRFNSGKAMFRRPESFQTNGPNYDELQKLPPEIRERVLRQLMEQSLKQN